MVEFGKGLLSSQFMQVPDTPTDFHRPSTSRSTELAKALETPPPQLPKESGSGPVMSTTYQELVLILPIKFYSDLSTLSVCQDFRFPRFVFPPSTPLCPRIAFELKTVHRRHKIFLDIKFH